MEGPPHLDGRHQHTYEAIFRHPTAHNLEWHDVRSLLDDLGDVEEEHDGSSHVTRNGMRAILHPPRHKDVASVEDMLAIRHFLDQSGASAFDPAVATGKDRLVVIDHHEARIYRSERPVSVPAILLWNDDHHLKSGR